MEKYVIEVTFFVKLCVLKQLNFNKPVYVVRKEGLFCFPDSIAYK